MTIKARFRRTAVLIGITALVVTLAACGGKARKGEVIVYTSVDQPRSEPVFRAFQESTGIEVKAAYDVEASKTTGLVNRLAAEVDHPRADVFWSSEVIQTAVLAERGVLAGYVSPSAGNIPAALKDPRGRWTGLGLRARVILINNELVPKEKNPETIFDLLDSTWKPGDVGMALPLFGTSFTQAVVLDEVLGEGATDAFYEKARENGVRILNGNARVAQLVADGMLKAGLTDSDDAFEVMKKGANVRMVIPAHLNEGGLFIPGTVALVRGAPHSAEGRKLIDWLLSAAVERKLIERGYFYRSVRSPPETLPDSWGEPAAKVTSVRARMQRIFLR